MIERLEKLEIEGFRAFSNKASVPLDADIVLIYGPNGSGKTSVLSALEYAMIGSVADLRGYIDDYPRCLWNDETSGQKHVALRYYDDDQEARVIRRGILDGDRAKNDVFSDVQISAEDQRFFGERCYLSQSKLSRLLEIYQSIGSDGGEQPLVRFITELLGIDMLENLTSGLYEVGDRRRLYKTCTKFKELDEKDAKTERLVDEAVRDKNEKSAYFDQEICASIEELFLNLECEKPAKALGPESLHEWRDALDQQFEKHEVERSESHMLVEKCNELEVALVTLKQDVDNGDLDSRKLENDLKKMRDDRDLLEKRLKKAITPMINKLTVEQTGSLGIESVTDVGQRFDVIEAAINEHADRLELRVDASKRAQVESTTLIERLKVLKKSVKRLENQLKPLNDHERMFSVLDSARRLVQNELCPVCGRDYSEVGAEKISERIQNEINTLGTNIAQLKERSRECAELRIEMEQAQQEKEALETKLSHENESLDELQNNLDSVRSLSKQCGNLKEIREEWRIAWAEAENLVAEISAAKIRQKQVSKSRETVDSLLDEMNMTHEEETEIEKSGSELLQRLREQITTASEKNERYQQAYEKLNEAAQVARELAELESKIQDAKKYHAKIKEAKKQADEVIKMAREVASAATQTKTKLLKTVFSDTLNSLWSQLFSRLVQGERFRPQLGGPDVSQGRLQAQIQGIAEGEEPFNQLAAVLSSGNLNTAALSLFLALHLIEEPRHRLLVLDDPVQNMDDVRVMELARLLRAIVYEADRQLIVAVHEPALYEYLCLELGPQERGQHMIAIELSREHESHSTDVSCSRYSWEPDLLKIG